jgi:hypothetical protein
MVVDRRRLVPMKMKPVDKGFDAIGGGTSAESPPGNR